MCALNASPPAAAAAHAEPSRPKDSLELYRLTAAAAAAVDSTQPMRFGSAHRVQFILAGYGCVLGQCGMKGESNR